MTKTKFSKILSLLICITLITATALFATSCSDNSTTPETTTAAAEETTVQAEETTAQAQATEVGEGEKQFTFTVVDMDGNKVVNRDDVMALLWHVNFPTMFSISAPADFDHNNSVDRDDVMTLLWYVNFPDLFPLEPTTSNEGA